MKKAILILLVSLLANNLIFGQKSSFSKGNVLLGIGLGVNSYYTGGFPVGATAEFGITDDISIGGSVDYFSHSYGISGYGYKFTVLYIGGRGSYHFNNLLKIENKKIDLYGGATLGYRVFSWNDSFSNLGLSNSYSSGLFFGGFVGGKYYFKEKISTFVELGAIGSTNARVGIGFKL